MKENFILLAYDFPPFNSGGNQRASRFANYFFRNNYNPIVVTVNHAVCNSERSDISLLKDLPTELKVIRTPIKKKSFLTKLIDTGYLFHPDSIAYRWDVYLKTALDEAIKKYNPRFALITVPPFSLLKFSTRYFREKKIPFILDLRDPLSFWVGSPFPSKIHYNFLKKIEINSILNSSLTLVVTPEMKNIYERIYQNKTLNIKVIYNSYDSLNDNHRINAEKRFTIGYFGSFYFDPYSARLKDSPWWEKKPYQYLQYTPFKQDWKYRSPFYFFKALNVLLSKHPEYTKKIKVVFAGTKPDWFDNMVGVFGLSNIVTHRGFLPKESIKELEKECDAFLITSSKFIGAKDYCIAGKTYEYFQNSKPIIAFVTEGDQKWIVENSGLGLVCDPDNLQGSIKKLEGLIVRKNMEFIPDYIFLDQFKTKNQLNKLHNLIQKLY